MKITVSLGRVDSSVLYVERLAPNESDAVKIESSGEWQKLASIDEVEVVNTSVRHEYRPRIISDTFFLQSVKNKKAVLSHR